MLVHGDNGRHTKDDLSNCIIGVLFCNSVPENSYIFFFLFFFFKEDKCDSKTGKYHELWLARFIQIENSHFNS